MKREEAVLLAVRVATAMRDQVKIAAIQRRTTVQSLVTDTLREPQQSAEPAEAPTR